jgi:hypothetical protein
VPQGTADTPLQVGHEIGAMGRIRRLVIVFGVLAVLLALAIALGSSGSSKQRRIAADLLQLQRRWETTDDVPALFRSLTNLPFRKGAATDEKSYVYHQYGFLGIHCDEYYFIQRPRPVTNAPEWTFYHAWYWNGHRQLAMHKLLTISDK